MSFGRWEQIWKSNQTLTLELSLPHLQADFPPTANSSIPFVPPIKTAVFLFVLLPFPAASQDSFFKFCAYLVSLGFFGGGKSDMISCQI